VARIRTIKPEFFTSADVVSCEPLARLLFQGLWCEADREGRLVWRPETLKLRYLPADACDVGALCQQLIDRRMVVLYGDGLAYLPSFARHQRVNPREAASDLPTPGADPHACSPRIDACTSRIDASNPEVHAQVGREGKGKEGKGREDASARVTGAPAAVPSTVIAYQHPDAGAMPNRRRKAHCAWESARGLDVPHELHAELLGKMAPRDEPALLRWYAETERDWRDLPVGDTCWAFWRARFREWVGTTVTPLVPDKPDTSGWATAALTAVPR
jgi:hypothetical protein